MRIVVDRVRCQATGTCESLRPDVFQVDESGSLAVLRSDVTDADVADLQRVADHCPTGALSLTGD